MIRLLKEMLREEWRLHTRLFGSIKFALFPLAVVVLTGLVYRSLPWLAFDEAGLQYGMHLLMVFLGLNIGAVGFVGRSRLNNLLGDTNMLIYSSRTLPVSKLEILSTFILKDLIYYYGFFILPLIAGRVLGGYLAGSSVLLASYPLAFVAGLSLTFLISVVLVRSKLLLGLLVGTLAGSFYLFDVSVATLNLPYVFYQTGSLTVLGVTLVASAALFGFGAIFFGFEPAARPAETRKDTLYRKASPHLSALSTKDIIDVLRSSGGAGKLCFSYAILIGVYYFMVSSIPMGSAFMNAPMLTLATLLGISSITTYNWLNRFDAMSEYMILPVTKKDVIGSKIASFVILTVPLIFVALGSAAFLFTPSATVFLHSVLIAVISSAYILGVTIQLTELRPNAMILDVTVFLKFLFASGAILVPFMIASILYPVNTTNATVGLFALYIMASSLSYILLTHKVNR